jgi:DNA repair exonuclease SbcCD ATPase subunit
VAKIEPAICGHFLLKEVSMKTDETKETTQDTSPEKETPSGGKPGTTSEPEAKTYTEEEKQKAISDALAKAGREAKALADKEAALNARQEAIDAKQAEIDEAERRKEAAEFEAAKGDPELLRAYQDKQASKKELADILKQKADLKKEREVLDRDKADHEAEINEAKEAQHEILVWQVASDKGIDPVRLKNLSVKFKIEGKEQLEELADEIASGKPETPNPLKVDSGVTTGGGEKSEEQKLKERYPTMK